MLPIKVFSTDALQVEDDKLLSKMGSAFIEVHLLRTSSTHFCLIFLELIFRASNKLSVLEIVVVLLVSITIS